MEQGSGCQTEANHSQQSRPKVAKQSPHMSLDSVKSQQVKNKDVRTSKPTQILQTNLNWAKQPVRFFATSFSHQSPTRFTSFWPRTPFLVRSIHPMMLTLSKPTWLVCHVLDCFCKLICENLWAPQNRLIIETLIFENYLKAYPRLVPGSSGPQNGVHLRWHLHLRHQASPAMALHVLLNKPWINKQKVEATFSNKTQKKQNATKKKTKTLA